MFRFTLIDLSTGKAGDLGVRRGADGALSVSGLIIDGGLVSHELGTERVVIDLKNLP